MQPNIVFLFIIFIIFLIFMVCKNKKKISAGLSVSDPISALTYSKNNKESIIHDLTKIS